MFKLIVDLINKKTYKVIARLIVGSLTLMFLTGIIPVAPGLVDTAYKAKADIVIGESTSVDPSYYKDNTNGGIMNIRDVPFSVAISRDKDTYVQVKNGYNIVKSNYKAKFAYEPDSEVWFINENLVYKDPKGFSVADVCSKKISLSRYNPSSGKLNIYYRETYNLSTPKGTVRMPGNAFMIPSSVSVSDPTSLLVFYKQLLKYKNLSDYRKALSGGKWKNLINSVGLNTVKSKTLQLWGYVFKNDKFHFDVDGRLNNLLNPKKLNLNDIINWKYTDALDVKARILSLMIQTYALMDFKDTTYAKIWEKAIEDYITEANLTQSPICLVINIGTIVAPGLWNTGLTAKHGGVLINIIDYINYVALVYPKFAINLDSGLTEFRNFVSETGTWTSFKDISKNTVYKGILRSLQESKKINPSSMRLSDRVRELGCDGFLWGITSTAKYFLTSCPKYGASSGAWLKKTSGMTTADFIDILKIYGVDSSGSSTSGYVLAVIPPYSNPILDVKVKLNIYEIKKCEIGQPISTARDYEVPVVTLYNLSPDKKSTQILEWNGLLNDSKATGNTFNVKAVLKRIYPEGGSTKYTKTWTVYSSTNATADQLRQFLMSTYTVQDPDLGNLNVVSSSAKYEYSVTVIYRGKIILDSKYTLLKISATPTPNKAYIYFRFKIEVENNTGSDVSTSVNSSVKKAYVLNYPEQQNNTNDTSGIDLNQPTVVIGVKVVWVGMNLPPYQVPSTLKQGDYVLSGKVQVPSGVFNYTNYKFNKFSLSTVQSILQGAGYNPSSLQFERESQDDTIRLNNGSVVYVDYKCYARYSPTYTVIKRFHYTKNGTTTTYTSDPETYDLSTKVTCEPVVLHETPETDEYDNPVVKEYVLEDYMPLYTAGTDFDTFVENLKSNPKVVPVTYPKKSITANSVIYVNYYYSSSQLSQKKVKIIAKYIYNGTELSITDTLVDTIFDQFVQQYGGTYYPDYIVYKTVNGKSKAFYTDQYWIQYSHDFDFDSTTNTYIATVYYYRTEVNVYYDLYYNGNYVTSVVPDRYKTDKPAVNEFADFDDTYTESSTGRVYDRDLAYPSFMYIDSPEDIHVRYNYNDTEIRFIYYKFYLKDGNRNEVYEGDVFYTRVKVGNAFTVPKKSSYNGFTYDLGLNTTTLKAEGTVMYIPYYREVQILTYVSEPSAYAEIKEGTPGNETFEAMAGVPTTRRLYFAAGGSEFVVDIELEYIKGEKAVRKYKARFDGTPCEYKGTGPGKDGWPGADIPTPPGNYSASSLCFDHRGGTITITWTGKIPNLNKTKAEGVHSATAPAIPDWTEYNNTLNAVNEWKSRAESELRKWSWTAASDGVTRTWSNATIIVNSVPNSPKDVTVTVPCNYKPPRDTDGDGKIDDPGHPCENEKAVAEPAPDGSFTITATITMPAHILCGPACEYDLPPVEDTWTQEIKYDYIKINKVKVWKIDQAKVDGMSEILDSGEDVVKATIVRGDPNIFYNIAKQTYPSMPNSSRAGRLRYTVEPQQHDDVVWNLGPRSNKWDGGSSNPNVPPYWHNHKNAVGCLYTNSGYPHKEDFHLQSISLNTTGYTNKADSKDVLTPEWKKFDELRHMKVDAYVISDFLILQTSSGDQSVMYFQKKAPKSVETQQDFDYVKATIDEMWTNNPNSAAKWTPDQINIGSYNGNYSSPTTKYVGTGHGERVSTYFEPDPAQTIVRPSRPSGLMLYKDNIVQRIDNPNGMYVTGNAEVFYKKILDYVDTSVTVDSSPYYSYYDDFYGAEGFTISAPYSPNHTKINDIVIHNPVSTEFAIIPSYDSSLDQRTTLPPGSALDVIDALNKAQAELNGLFNSGKPKKLDCKYFEDITYASFNFDDGTITNLVNNVKYAGLDGTTIDNSNKFGTNKALYVKGRGFSIPLNDINFNTYEKSLEVKFEGDFYIVKPSNGYNTLFGYKNYQAMVDNQGRLCITTGNNDYRVLTGVDVTNKNIRLAVVFSYYSSTKCRVYINGTEYMNFMLIGTPQQITADIIGDTIYIGASSTFNSSSANYYVDNLKIIKLAGYSTHQDYCYVEQMVHPDGLNVHMHTSDCLTPTSDTSNDGIRFVENILRAYPVDTVTLKQYIGDTIYNAILPDLNNLYKAGNVTITGIFDFEGSTTTIVNKINGKSYSLPTGFSILTDNKLGYGSYLYVNNGVRLSIPLSDLGIVSNSDFVNPIYVEAIINIPSGVNAAMLFSFYKFDLFIKDNKLIFNTGNDVEKYLDFTNYFNKTIKLGVLFDPISVDRSKIYINGSYVPMKRQNQSLFPILGSTFNIGSWGVDNGYPVTAYIDNLVIGKLNLNRQVWDYGFTGSVQIFTAPQSGNYMLITWGAQGGGSPNYPDAGYKGGFAAGEVILNTGGTLYVYVGGKGGNSSTTNIDGGDYVNNNGGWNGGGNGSGSFGPGGGGATDIRQGGQSITNRILVAGGGGGRANPSGSTIGGEGGNNDSSKLYALYNGESGCTIRHNSSWPNDEAGGGGGYYGGKVVHGDDAASWSGSYGGSNYTGGVKYGVSIAGNQPIPTWDLKLYQIGNSGNGYAKIVYVGEDLSFSYQQVPVNQVFNYGYTGNYQVFTAPADGRYKLEVWGAEGGRGGDGNYMNSSWVAGKGGYSVGELDLKAGDILYVFVGGRGQAYDYRYYSYGVIPGGWNGGGDAYHDGYEFGGSGGGATDIRYAIGSGAWNDPIGLYSRIIVAGGGGGTGEDGERGGDGGGISSVNGYFSNYNATQSSPGTGYYTSASGGFGYGASYYSSGESGGGGGGGWYGGGGGDYAGSGGGSGYVLTSSSYKPSGYNSPSKYYLSNAQTIAGNQTMPSPYGGTEVGHSGDGFARITFMYKYVLDSYNNVGADPILNQLDEGILSKILNTIRSMPNDIPDEVDGAKNPIFTCSRIPNVHVCNEHCHIEKVLACTEPHHQGMHYNQDSPICWIDDDSVVLDLYNPPSITTPSGNTIRSATFLLLDNTFKVYFPNKGNFAQEPNLWGIPQCTDIRGKGFVDNMDTTEWTKRKMIRFSFPVIYNGIIYPEMTWIDLPIRDSNGNVLEWYDFYIPLAAGEQVAGWVQFQVEAINSLGYNDNMYQPNNKQRYDNFAALHGGFREYTLDVIGRIGNLMTIDSDDFRFSNYFKQPVSSNEWIVQDVIKQVDPSIQRKILGYYRELDLLGRNTLLSKGYNPYGTLGWTQDIGKFDEMPICGGKNDNQIVKYQEQRLGYKTYYSILSIGDYYYGKLQVVPYIYVMNIRTGQMLPADAYMKLDSGEYVPINIHGIVTDGWDQDAVYPYIININWKEDADRLNYNGREKEITENVAKIYGKAIWIPDSNGTVSFAGFDEADKPENKYTPIGTAQLLLIDGRSRTFIGDTSTYGVDNNPNSYFDPSLYWRESQRWIFAYGLPDSTVFVEHGKPLTDENIKAVNGDEWIAIITASIKVIGDKYVLEYRNKVNNGYITVKLLDGTIKTYSFPLSLYPVIAVYATNYKAYQDVTIKQSH